MYLSLNLRKILRIITFLFHINNREFLSLDCLELFGILNLHKFLIFANLRYTDIA